MNKLVIKAWKDPVWSKIIATTLISIFVYLFYHLTSTNYFRDFFSQKIQLWSVVLISVVTILLISLATRIRIFRYTDETLNIDRILFNEIRKRHLTPDMMKLIQDNVFSSCPFDIKSLTTITDFLNENKKADFDFFNPKLEKLKQTVVNQISNFQEITSRYVFSHGTGCLSIPMEWEFNQPERMQKAMSEIRRHEDALSAAYQAFIYKGRRILKV